MYTYIMYTTHTVATGIGKGVEIALSVDPLYRKQVIHRHVRSVAGGAGTDRSRTEVVLLARPLRCHSCYKSIHGQACVDLDRAYTDIKRCRDDQPYCMVSTSHAASSNALPTQ